VHKADILNVRNISDGRLDIVRAVRTKLNGLLQYERCDSGRQVARVP